MLQQLEQEAETRKKGYGLAVNSVMNHPTKKRGQRTRSGKDTKDCAHSTLVKMEQSGINEIDTDVLIYACSKCGKHFTIRLLIQPWAPSASLGRSNANA
jgi:hypothetical protein